MSDLIVGAGTGSGQTTCPAGNTLVTEVARFIGDANQTSIRAQALDTLNRARRDLNMLDFRFMKRSKTSTALSDTVQTYSLGSSYKSGAYFQLLDSGGKPARVLTYKDDAQFVHQEGTQTRTGEPIVYWIRNSFADGLISFYPIPDAGAASAWTWAGEYYTRIGVISDSSSAITELPEEACNALVLGGQAYMIRERDKTSPVIPAALASYRNAIETLKAFDRRNQDDNPRFRIGRRSNLLLTADQILGTF